MLAQFLRDTFTFFNGHIKSLCAIVLPIIIPIELLSALLLPFSSGEELTIYELAIPMLLGLAVYPIYSVAIIFYIASVISKDSIDIKTLWRLGLKYWLPYLLLVVLINIFVAFGLLLFIIPGIILSVRYAFSELELLLKNAKPLDAISNSWRMTKNYFWEILGGGIIIFILIYLPLSLVTLFIEQAGISFWWIDLLMNIYYAIASILFTIFCFRIYEFANQELNRSSGTDSGYLGAE